MKLEQQVCSLELAKKLKELGVKQESLWWWQKQNHTDTWNIEDMQICAFDEDWYSAFTVAELGEMLPKGIRTDKKVHGNEWCVYDYGQAISDTTYHQAKTEANARAKMVIYLKEKN